MSASRYPREPDFAQFLSVMRNERPQRPTLFEFFLNDPLFERLVGTPVPSDPGAFLRSPGSRDEVLAQYRKLGRWFADAFAIAGYDYVTLPPHVVFPGYEYRNAAHATAASHSLNDQPLLTSWDELEGFPWPDPAMIDPAILEALTSDFPEGMRALITNPDGVLEILVDLVGYDNLCFMLVDDRELVAAIAGRIGESLLPLYRATVDHPRVGALISSDDWGFKTQTMISPADLREFVFPWHREMVSIAHAADKPILLHSCGQLTEVMDDVIDDLGFDAKHSFEDVIEPVEEIYERFGDRIAILGGIDLGFLCDASHDEITRRSRAMLERSRDRGGYALGSGNSIPDWVPHDAYFAMTRAALEG